MVVQIRASRTFRGTEKYIGDLCRELAVRGYSPAAITLPSGPLVSLVGQMGMPVFELPIRGDVNPFTPFLIAGALRKCGAELVNTHGSHGSCLCNLGARLAGIPSVHTVHGPDNKYAGMPAAHLIAISEHVRQHLIRQGVSQKRISVVRNGVDVHKFVPQEAAGFRAEMGLSADWFCFSVVAMFEKYKGLSFLLETFRTVADKAPNARLLIAGSGPLEADLRLQVERLNLSHFVRFLGFCEDVRPVISASDCLVLPSECEGLGLVLLEAMASGRPVIATDSGGPKEIVDEGVTGMIVPVNDIEKMRNAMLYALRNLDWTREAGTAAREYVVSERSVEREVDEIEEVYCKVLKHG